MADFISPIEHSPIVSSASSSAAAAKTADDDDDSFEDACSICLEPFNTDDPATITSCKHEYHLHCILEWSQRSKDCPICSQFILLKEPDSQELLEAVRSESSVRAKRSAGVMHEVNHYSSHTYDSEVDERIMLHLASASSRARFVSRRARRSFSGSGHPQVSNAPTLDTPNLEQGDAISLDQCYIFDNTSMEYDTPPTRSSGIIRNINDENQSFGSPYNTVPNLVGTRDQPTKFRGLFGRSPESPHKPSSSEFLALSDSLKSRFSAASLRYKETLSKSTQGFKEKLLARNISVKELGKEVQREMNAGIAGVTKMMERIDLTSKRRGVSVPLSSCTAGPQDPSYKGKGVQVNVITPDPDENSREFSNYRGSAAPTYVNNTFPSRLEISLDENGKR